MKLGLFMMPLHGVGGDYTAMYQQDYDAALHADRCGFDEVFVGEHYSARVEPISNTLQFMSALIPTAKNITFGTGVLNLPHHHPAKIAADVALFDHMSRGRLIMGIGPGGLPSDFELFGTVEKNRSEMMVECIDIVHQIWASDPPYEIDGQHWSIKIKDMVMADLDIGPIPKPFQRPYPPVAVSAMSPFSGTARLAGSRGWSLISANFNPSVHTRSHWEAYSQGCEQAGRKPDRRDWRVARSIVVTETDSEARDYLADPSNSVTGYYHYLREQFQRAGLLKIMKPDLEMDDGLVTDAFCVETMVIAGSPQTVLNRLAAEMEQIGSYGVLLSAFHEWDQPDLWRRSMELLATKVVPQLGALANQRR